jgi:hypothetical protein
MAKMGAPRKLSPRTVRAIYAALQGPQSVRDVCAYFGISTRTAAGIKARRRYARDTNVSDAELSAALFNYIRERKMVNAKG